VQKMRLDAAKQLFRESSPYDPEQAQPEFVPQLARILASDAEPDVRAAAACMLGSYGNEHAIEPLVAALADADVAPTAVSSLYYLAIYLKDSRIADGLCGYLEKAHDPGSVSTAISVLEREFADPRLAAIALRILDGDVNDQLRTQAAFAFAATGDSAA